MSAFVAENQGQAKAESLLLAQRVRNYFKDERHRKEFEIWYQKRYGRPYQWKGIST